MNVTRSNCQLVLAHFPPKGTVTLIRDITTLVEEVMFSLTEIKKRLAKQPYSGVSARSFKINIVKIRFTFNPIYCW